MKNPIIVLYANKYRVQDESRRTEVSGISVSYIFGDSLNPTTDNNGTKGQRPAKGNLQEHLFDKIINVPALYDGEFDMATDKDGKLVLKLTNVEYVSAISLTKKPTTA